MHSGSTAMGRNLDKLEQMLVDAATGGAGWDGGPCVFTRRQRELIQKARVLAGNGDAAFGDALAWLAAGP